MPGDTSIAWAGKTWNVAVVGCREVTEECANCYARDIHNRWARSYTPGGAGAVQYNAPFTPARRMREVLGDRAYTSRLRWPLHVRKPSLIFVNSMTDLLESVATEQDIGEVFAVMRQAHWHTFQILTKRAGRLQRLGPQLDWPPNVWMGVSIGMNKYLPRAHALAVGAAAAAVRFLSCEPLLDDLCDLTPAFLRAQHIDWVIVGAESGRGNQGEGKWKRPIQPMDLDWARRIRDACVTVGVPFFLKQTVDPATGRKTQLPALDGAVWAQYPPILTQAFAG